MRTYEAGCSRVSVALQDIQVQSRAARTAPWFLSVWEAMPGKSRAMQQRRPANRLLELTLTFCFLISQVTFHAADDDEEDLRIKISRFHLGLLYRLGGTRLVPNCDKLEAQIKTPEFDHTHGLCRYPISKRARTRTMGMEMYNHRTLIPGKDENT